MNPSPSPQGIIHNALNQNISILSEKDSAELLNFFDIPVVSNKLVKSAREAVDCANTMGLPVVIKGCGSGIAHKSELGLVKPGLQSPNAVQAAAEDLLKKAPENMDGLLVQPMVRGKREFVAGMFRDPLFGAVIVFGLGGIFTEALHDVAFRLAPLCDKDIMSMLSEFKGKALLGAFRGEAPVDMALLKRTLKGLSGLAIQYPGNTRD